ncbi:MAG: hypothetical protein HN718_14380, partial [Rhodospirillales bacterium]|nr:hypothetical protein [Rhodospirillales bacterium]
RQLESTSNDPEIHASIVETRNNLSSQTASTIERNGVTDDQAWFLGVGALILLGVMNSDNGGSGDDDYRDPFDAGCDALQYETLYGNCVDTL